MDTSSSHASASKTAIERIGEIKDITEFAKLMVNAINTSGVCVNANKIKVGDTPCLFHKLCIHFILFVGDDFNNWMECSFHFLPVLIFLQL